jgi:hypothetical protein
LSLVEEHGPDPSGDLAAAPIMMSFEFGVLKEVSLN